MPLVAPANPETPAEGPQEGKSTGFKDDATFNSGVEELVQAFAVLLVTGLHSGQSPKNLDAEEQLEQVQMALMKRIIEAANKIADAFNPDAQNPSPQEQESEIQV